MVDLLFHHDIPFRFFGPGLGFWTRHVLFKIHEKSTKVFQFFHHDFVRVQIMAAMNVLFARVNIYRLMVPNLYYDPCPRIIYYDINILIIYIVNSIYKYWYILLYILIYIYILYKIYKYASSHQWWNLHNTPPVSPCLVLVNEVKCTHQDLKN